MALTKEQVSLVTVATLGIAPGGFTADLMNLGSQKELANVIASLGTPEFTTYTNAEFVNNVAKNLGTKVDAKDKIAFFKALEGGATRADAAVDFANAQLVEHGKIDKVDTAAKSLSTSTDLPELAKVITPVVVSDVDASLSIDLAKGTTATGTTTTTTSNIGKTAIDAGTPKKSADYTFELKNQIGETNTFDAKFLSPVLDRKAADSTGSQIVLELRNLREDNSSVEPLKGLKVDGIAFFLEGKILKVASEQINAALTYEQLKTAIEARVAELVTGDPAKMPSGSDGESANPADYAGLATFTVTLGGDFTVTNDSGTDVSGKKIVLTDAAGQEIEPITTTDAPGLVVGTGFTLYGELKSKGADEVAKSISTNLNADNVGYGSQGATLNIAGQSASNKGIEELNVKATNGVWFTALKSEKATHHLETINLQTGSNGYFRVGTQENSVNHVVSLTSQDFTTGGLVDVQEVNADQAGSTAINSFITTNVLNRYDFKDTGTFDADDKDVDINYNLSSDKDVLNLAISTQVLAAVDTQVNVNTGAGDDFITVQATEAAASAAKVGAAIQDAGTGWLVNQQLNNNIKIDAGTGNDWILTPGAGNATINAGAGNDVVRVDNAGDRGVFVFNNATTDVKELIAGGGFNQGLTSNSDNTLSSGVTTSVAQTFDFFKATVKVTFKGFESKYVTIDSTNYTTSAKQINQAIKEAVNTNPVLNKLIAAMDNAGNALAIESLIDGKLDLATDLKIDITLPIAYDASETATQKATREDAGQLMLANGEEAKADTAYKAAGKAGFVASSATTTDVDAAYAPEFATTGTAGPAFGTAAQTVSFSAATAETQTITFTDGITVADGTIDVGGVTVSLAVATHDDATKVAAKVAADLQAAITGGTAINGVTFPVASASTAVTSALGVVTIIYPAVEGNVAANITVGAVSAGATLAAPTVAEGTAGNDATGETNTLTFAAGDTLAAGESITITIDGTSYTYTATAALADKDAVSAALDTALTTAFTDYDFADATGTLTITQKTDKEKAIADITSTKGGSLTTKDGLNSNAESDNVIDLGTGSDVLVLGTGAESNDTVVFKGYNLGEKTIVNFTTAANTDTPAQGDDLLDFSAYLNSVDATTKALVTKGVGTTFADNNVTLVTFGTDNKLTTTADALTFDKLTDANVKALLNSADAEGQINGLNNFGTDATNHVLMLQDGTENVYKAFHVTTGTTANVATDVKLIGTFDFGDADITGLATVDLV